MSWLFSFINTTTVLLQPQGLVTYSHLILRHFSILPALVISVAYSVVLLFLVLLFLLYFFLVYFTQYLKSKAANKKYCHGSLLVGSRLFNLCNRFRHEISNFHYPITTYYREQRFAIYIYLEVSTSTASVNTVMIETVAAGSRAVWGHCTGS